MWTKYVHNFGVQTGIAFDAFFTNCGNKKKIDPLFVIKNMY
jgi:hypothetical protein